MTTDQWTGPLVLVGLMGAGKTTVGRLVAGRLARPFADSDAWLQARTGRTAREIEKSEGVDRLHRLEAEHLLGAIDAGPSSVIAAAASVADDAACRRRLADPDVAVVWLRALPTTVAARFASGAHRPGSGGDAVGMYAEQLARRGPFLARLADLVLDVDDVAPRELAGRIVDYVGSNRQTSTSRTGS